MSPSSLVQPDSAPGVLVVIPQHVQSYSGRSEIIGQRDSRNIGYLETLEVKPSRNADDPRFQVKFTLKPKGNGRPSSWKKKLGPESRALKTLLESPRLNYMPLPLGHDMTSLLADLFKKYERTEVMGNPTDAEVVEGSSTSKEHEPEIYLEADGSPNYIFTNAASDTSLLLLRERKMNSEIYIYREGLQGYFVSDNEPLARSEKISKKNPQYPLRLQRNTTTRDQIDIFSSDGALVEKVLTSSYDVDPFKCLLRQRLQKAEFDQTLKLEFFSNWSSDQSPLIIKKTTGKNGEEQYIVSRGADTSRAENFVQNLPPNNILSKWLKDQPPPDNRFKFTNGPIFDAAQYYMKNGDQLRSVGEQGVVPGVNACPDLTLACDAWLKEHNQHVFQTASPFVVEETNGKFSIRRAKKDETLTSQLSLGSLQRSSSRALVQRGTPFSGLDNDSVMVISPASSTASHASSAYSH
jgi:hypothetical protein